MDSEAAVKRCSSCGEVKRIEEFRRRNDVPTGRRGTCRNCEYRMRDERENAREQPMNWDNIRNLNPTMTEWATLDQLNRRLAYLQRVYMRDYEVSSKEARATAAAEESLKLGWTPAELESACAFYRYAVQRLNQAQNGVDTMTAPTATNGTGNDHKCTINGTFKDLYRGVCLFTDFIPADGIWVYLFGVSDSIGYTNRGELRKEGFEFEKAEHGCWRVTARPKIRPVMTEEDIQLLTALVQKAREAGFTI
jgi:hypothetical protein